MQGGTAARMETCSLQRFRIAQSPPRMVHFWASEDIGTVTAFPRSRPANQGLHSTSTAWDELIICIMAAMEPLYEVQLHVR